MTAPALLQFRPPCAYGARAKVCPGRDRIRTTSRATAASHARTRPAILEPLSDALPDPYVTSLSTIAAHPMSP